ncbi:hypothetical protein [Pseudoflavonifractor capillosus]|uniref:hypothetical protein n=1 Tax=Pseudoflavonifractor capillosus TaxID=106588 RepID=UPI001FA799B8|nr:hypothetical protein [Pseudoflavonifractor capillosus]
MRKAILDGEIPITMPVGFALNSPRNTSFISAIDRNHCCQESMIAVASNVSNIILVGDVGEVVDIEEQAGEITTGNAVWRSLGRHDCRPINPDQHMFTATDPMSIKFIVRKAAGYHSMAENAAFIGNDTYFPLNTVHALVDYIRVLPLRGDKIEVRYYNGMTPEMFRNIWDSAQ